MLELNKIYNEDCIETISRMEDESINCIVTSPPYWGLRDYGHNGQLGVEKTPEEYVAKIAEIFREIKRVLKKDGTVWLNLGDSYNGSGKASSGGGTGEYSKLQQCNIGSLQITEPTRVINLKPKDLIGIPWRVAFALQADGWYLRRDIIWDKPNPMPESTKDRPTSAHEYIFLLSKSAKYYYDYDAITESITTFENRDPGIVRDRELYPDSKQHKLGKFKTPFGWDTSPGSHNKKTGRYKKQDRVGKNTYTGFNDRYKEKMRGYKPKDGDNGQSEQHHGNDINTTLKRNKRSVWRIATQPFPGAHFAVFPEKLIEPMILAGCPEDGIIYDPFMGAGTTAKVALRANRKFIGSELSPEYCKIANDRIESQLKQTDLFYEGG